MSGLIDKIAVLGREFTIQTEYVPGENAKVRTLVYDGGRLVTSREIPAGDENDRGVNIDDTVHRQHQRIAKTLLTRAKELEEAKTTTREAPAPKPEPAPAPPPGAKTMARPVVEPG